MSPAATPFDALMDAVNQFKADAVDLPAARRLGSADADAIYGMAYNAMRLGQYRDASRCFGFLLYCHPANPVYLKGQAMCHQKLGSLNEAITVYALLSLLEDGKPEHPLAIAECHILLHEHAKAREALAVVVGYCTHHAGHDKVLSRARGLLELVRPKEAAHDTR